MHANKFRYLLNKSKIAFKAGVVTAQTGAANPHAFTMNRILARNFITQATSMGRFNQVSGKLFGLNSSSKICWFYPKTN